MTTRWEECYAQRMERMGSSIIRELLKFAQQPGVISFAGGLPAPELFPVKELEEACCKILQEKGSQALQYGATEGYSPLREFIVEKMGRYGIKATLDNVLITHGSQQALDLIGKVFIDPGDTILLEAPSYLGGIQAFTAYQPRYITVPMDDEGMRVDLVEEELEKGCPKFIYVLPNFQNPAGVTLSLERRERLVVLANECGVPLIEDDPYGELRYEGDHLPPLVVLDDRHLSKRSEGRANAEGFFEGNVIYMSTFSKTLAPGLRLGWVVAPVEVVSRLVQAKQGADLHTSTLTQVLAYEVVRTGFLDDHVRELRKVYRERRDVMLKAMEEHFPEGVTWTRPQGGLFLWVTVPEEIDTAELLKEAVEEKVAFVPGFAFHADGRGQNTMRLNFSYAQPEMIREGIRRLGKVIEKRLEKAKAVA